MKKYIFSILFSIFLAISANAQFKKLDVPVLNTGEKVPPRSLAATANRVTSISNLADTANLTLQLGSVITTESGEMLVKTASGFTSLKNAGPKGDKGDTGATGTVDYAVLDNYATNTRTDSIISQNNANTWDMRGNSYTGFKKLGIKGGFQSNDVNFTKTSQTNGSGVIIGLNLDSAYSSKFYVLGAGTRYFSFSKYHMIQQQQNSTFGTIYSLVAFNSNYGNTRYNSSYEIRHTGLASYDSLKVGDGAGITFSHQKFKNGTPTLMLTKGILFCEDIQSYLVTAVNTGVAPFQKGTLIVDSLGVYFKKSGSNPSASPTTDATYPNYVKLVTEDTLQNFVKKQYFTMRSTSNDNTDVKGDIVFPASLEGKKVTNIRIMYLGGFALSDVQISMIGAGVTANFAAGGGVQDFTLNSTISTTNNSIVMQHPNLSTGARVVVTCTVE